MWVPSTDRNPFSQSGWCLQLNFFVDGGSGAPWSPVDSCVFAAVKPLVVGPPTFCGLYLGYCNQASVALGTMTGLQPCREHLERKVKWNAYQCRWNKSTCSALCDPLCSIIALLLAIRDHEPEELWEGVQSSSGAYCYHHLQSALS